MSNSKEKICCYYWYLESKVKPLYSAGGSIAGQFTIVLIEVYFFVNSALNFRYIFTPFCDLNYRFRELDILINFTPFVLGYFSVDSYLSSKKFKAMVENIVRKFPNSARTIIGKKIYRRSNWMIVILFLLNATLIYLKITSK